MENSEKDLDDESEKPSENDSDDESEKLSENASDEEIDLRIDNIIKGLKKLIKLKSALLLNQFLMIELFLT